jgi:hypothetical protein
MFFCYTGIPLFNCIQRNPTLGGILTWKMRSICLCVSYCLLPTWNLLREKFHMTKFEFYLHFVCGCLTCLPKWIEMRMTTAKIRSKNSSFYFWFLQDRWSFLCPRCFSFLAFSLDVTKTIDILNALPLELPEHIFSW